MGFISRKLFPACGNMCVCCPALRSRSRQPVKRYKKLISEIFPKSPDVQPNERKIVKLCEYAAKNPIRIPKITKLLEDKFYKELRNEHVKIVNIVMETYDKLLCICKKQIAYFAVSLLTLTDELLDPSKPIAVQIAGCQTLTKFIYSQTDGTYAHNIERFVEKVCMLARQNAEEQEICLLRASCLQCLSAMVWYMAEFFHAFDSMDEVIPVILDNYEDDVYNGEGRAERHRHWLEEVVRCEGRGGAGVPDASACFLPVSPPDWKNIPALTREENENPRVWSQICLQKVAELAKESSTMRQVLEPMLVYFDTGCHWSPQQGLAMKVLCDLSYFVEVPVKQMQILNGVIRHMEHKNVVRDPVMKSCVVQVAANLARQMRSGGAALADVGCIGDLLRHLRKSLQATASQIGEEEAKSNIHLQNSIESCLLEIAKGTKDARLMFDLLTMLLEKVPHNGIIARATMSSALILAHLLVAVYPHLQQPFPEALLVLLLKAMLHPDAEARVLAHQILSVLIFPSSWKSYETRRIQSTTSSTLDSVTSLLEKLRKEKDCIRTGCQGGNGIDDVRGRELNDDECQQTWARKNSPSVYKLSSIMDRTTGASNLTEAEPCTAKLSEDQIMQLLSGFWIQASLSDNLPSNYEAISHSYCLTLISSHMKSSNHGLVVSFFQLPLSLRNKSLCNNCGMLPPACQRSIFVTSTAMLLFAARMYHMHELNDLLRSQVPYDADPYLGINEDLQVYVKPRADLRKYGSAEDNQAAILFLSVLLDKNIESEKVILEVIVRYLCCSIKMEENELLSQLLATFSPDDTFMFAPEVLRELEHNQMLGDLRESSLDGDLSVSSVVEDDVNSALSVMNISGPKMVSPANSHIMSIGQLLESALEAAGQVVGTSISTSPLPYSTMTGHCEALETCTRKKLSNWLANDNAATRNLVTLPTDGQAVINNELPDADPNLGDATRSWPDQCCPLKLPPASPFDNFFRAASGPNRMCAEVST